MRLIKTSLVLLLTAQSLAQVSGSPDSTVPVVSIGSDTRPEEIKAASASLLQRNGSSPSFHVKMAISVQPTAGGAPLSGTYEELWADPQHWKRTLDLGDSHSQLLRVDDKNYVLQSGEKPPVEISSLASWLIPTFPEGTAGLEKQQVTVSGVTMLRVGEGQTSAQHPVIFNTEAWYLLPGTTRLAAATHNGAFIVYQKVATLTGKSVATAFVARTQSATTTATMNVLEANVKTSPDDFAVPTGATELGHDVRLSSGALGGNRISGASPIYPTQAKLNHESGTVVLNIRIGTDGRVIEMQVTSSPGPDLTQAAKDAVETYRYKPFLVNGKPVEVLSTINIVFSQRS